MRVYRSNRMEVLAEQLAEVLRAPVTTGDDPLQAIRHRDMVVVHSQGMARWLDMQLARKNRISANVEFPFPKAMVRDAIGKVLGDEADAWKVWQPNAMLWSTLEALADLLSEDAFEPLETYLAGRSTDPNQEGLGTADGVLLAREIADVFDRYITYRPDLVNAWEDSPEATDGWQAQLWRAVVARMETAHMAAKANSFRKLLGTSDGEVSGLPPRICIFGISTLPPSFLDIFAGLSALSEVHLFVLCPSNTYWADIRSKREQARALRHLEREQGAGAVADIATLHLDEGNPLLASFGRLGRDFQVVLEGQDVATPYDAADVEAFVDPAQESALMLHVLQSDILNLRARGGDGDEESPRPPQRAVADGDTSVAVHACYGAMRQVEALRDELLARLDADPTLQPRDIVVMSPDIERFAPLVEAVFGDASASPKIPFRIADRALGKENPVAELLVRVMDMIHSRLSGPEILDLLAQHPIQRRFGLREADLDILQEWIEKTGIRWGIDADDRAARYGQPAADGLNTWRFGLDRMLLGVAMPGHERDIFQGVLPYDEIEGGDAVTAGRLADACDALFFALKNLRDTQRQTPAAWVTVLKSTVDALVSLPDKDAWRIHQVHEVLDELATEATEAGCDRPVDFAAIRALLSRRLDKPRRAAGFVTGAVTFCAMVPMRSVPFKVVALLGMDEDAFPRKQRRVDFDLTLQHRRLGDRNPREEDRYLMLESLLAARDALVVIYTGYDAQTGHAKPPAAPIEEVLEVLGDSFEGGASHVVHHHPLHAFSPTLFGVAADPSDPPIPSVSHDARMLPAAQSMLSDPVDLPPWFTGPVSLPSSLDTVTIKALSDFYEHPAKSFLNKRFGVYLSEDEGGLQKREPMAIDSSLDQWAIRNAALQGQLQGDDMGLIRERRRLGGGLPLGVPGQLAHDAAARAVPGIVEEAEPLLKGDPVGLDVDQTVEGLRLVGRIDQLRTTGRVVVQASSLAEKYQIRLWINHVIRRAQGGTPAPSHLVGRARDGGGLLTLGTTMTASEAEEHLKLLVRYFLVGQQVPLLFIPRTSFAYFHALTTPPKGTSKKTPEERAWSAAIKVWDPSKGFPDKDRHHVMLWGDAVPFDAGFALPGVSGDLAVPFDTLAEAIWRPFVAEVSS